MIYNDIRTMAGYTMRSMRRLLLSGRYYLPILVLIPLLQFFLTTFFYQVVNSFDQEQKRSLLRFVTSCSRPPLLYVVFLSVFKIKTSDHILPLTLCFQRLQRASSQFLHPRRRIRSIPSSHFQHLRQSPESKQLKHHELRIRFSHASKYFQLPIYTSDQALRTKLLQAINSGAGFDLS